VTFVVVRSFARGSEATEPTDGGDGGPESPGAPGPGRPGSSPTTGAAAGSEAAPEEPRRSGNPLHGRDEGEGAQVLVSPDGTSRLVGPLTPRSRRDRRGRLAAAHNAGAYPLSPGLAAVRWWELESDAERGLRYATSSDDDDDDGSSEAADSSTSSSSSEDSARVDSSVISSASGSAFGRAASHATLTRLAGRRAKATAEAAAEAAAATTAEASGNASPRRPAADDATTQILAADDYNGSVGGLEASSAVDEAALARSLEWHRAVSSPGRAWGRRGRRSSSDQAASGKGGDRCSSDHHSSEPWPDQAGASRAVVPDQPPPSSEEAAAQGAPGAAAASRGLAGLTCPSGDDAGPCLSCIYRVQMVWLLVGCSWALFFQ